MLYFNNNKVDHNVLMIRNEFISLTTKYIDHGFTLNQLKTATTKKKIHIDKSWIYLQNILTVSIILLSVGLYVTGACEAIVNYLFGIRCILPNNYFVWEATRPISDCQFCINVKEPIILNNATREEFAPYAYTSKPVVIKKAALHWPAMQYFDFAFFKSLYEGIDDAVRSVDEECQFLHFKSNFISLQDVFNMSKSRILNENGEKSWYVGWGNCHPLILSKLRQFYPKPHFLPDDCEIPSKDYVFMGYDTGATMHLDFINRLMWQAQLKGSKTWYLQPSNECEHICNPVSFVVEPGDAVLVDTRVWYHGTVIKPGDFSLSIQSEYG